MPPKTRGAKISNVKENIEVSSKCKSKNTKKMKQSRKVLADKTNSASDDNVSLTSSNQVKITSALKSKEKENISTQPRQTRTRKIPARFDGNSLLLNLSNNNPTTDQTPVKTQNKKRISKPEDVTKPTSPVVKVVTKKKKLDNSLFKARPKRVCRLPSKLEDHSISPNKYIPLQPISASTPVSNKTVKLTSNQTVLNPKSRNKTTPLKSNKNPTKTRKVQAQPKENPGTKKQLHIDECFENQENMKAKKIIYDKNSSFRVFDDVKKSLKRDSSKIDPYEFTFDPNEEPQPQKKKKKRTVKKTQPKPKTVKGNYEKNLAKALATLKSNVALKKVLVENDTSIKQPCSETDKVSNNKELCNETPVNNKLQQVVKTREEINDNNSSHHVNNYNSVRIEDIAMDLQESDIGHTLNYSPVNSPHPTLPTTPHNKENKEIPVNSKDPLNLQEDLSFFDDHPVASSSMNVSVRHPLASPWRVEFGSLPIKWHVNSYVKPNMTPAVESSFINFNDSKKKHVYTNIVPQSNEPLPVAETNLKQSSIVSFIREVAEKNAKKKVNFTPVKENSLFEDISHFSNVVPTQNASANTSKHSSNSHSSLENSDPKTPTKNKNKDKEGTFFGFDETEDRENISPVKKNKRKRTLRSRAVLQEINDKGPFRAVIPVSAKSKPLLNSDNLHKNYEDPKSAQEPPAFLDKDTVPASKETTNVTPSEENSQSVHLFEDLDLLHFYHNKPIKSYGKWKNVTCRHNSVSDSDISENEEEQVSAEEDDLADLSFKLPSARSNKTKAGKKKLTKKEKISKKEDQEAEKWAAGFNSMCEDIEEFDLIVE